MEIDTYESSLRPNKILSVPAGTKLDTLSFPPDHDHELHIANLSQPTRRSFADGAQYAGFNFPDIKSQIAEKGFATYAASITVGFTQPRG